eukprot:TRINITY_DN19987_c0_g1_i1.p1 TRINITY_DN19987_c0_g1~~TRINITY_DN19987_c0_g1_i1.p1  ORF type:complete len:250 (+),score=39.78 TRINITY_DN19987_c0_g1_i1:60-752(+)
MLAQKRDYYTLVQLFDVLVNSQYMLELQVETHQVLVDILCQAEDVERALKLFEIIRQLPDHIRVDTFNSLLRGCWLARQESKVEYLVDVMQTEGIEFNALTYRYIIDVFMTSNNLFLCEQFYEMGIASGVYNFHVEDNPYSVSFSNLSPGESLLAVRYQLGMIRSVVGDGMPPQPLTISCDDQQVARQIATQIHSKFQVSPLTSFHPDNSQGPSQVVLLADATKKCIAQL